jgi:hypothetical protein
MGEISFRVGLYGAIFLIDGRDENHDASLKALSSQQRRVQEAFIDPSNSFRRSSGIRVTR